MSVNGFRIGELDQHVTIEAPPDPDNLTSFGEVDGDWTTFASGWAAIEPLSGRELFNAQQIHADISLQVKMWYVPDVTPKMRLKIGTRYLYIEQVTEPFSRRHELKMLCRESLNGN